MIYSRPMIATRQLRYLQLNTEWAQSVAHSLGAYQPKSWARRAPRRNSRQIEQQHEPPRAGPQLPSSCRESPTLESPGRPHPPSTPTPPPPPTLPPLSSSAAPRRLEGGRLPPPLRRLGVRTPRQSAPPLARPAAFTSVSSSGDGGTAAAAPRGVPLGGRSTRQGTPASPPRPPRAQPAARAPTGAPKCSSRSDARLGCKRSLPPPAAHSQAAQRCAAARPPARSPALKNQPIGRSGRAYLPPRRIPSANNRGSGGAPPPAPPPPHTPHRTALAMPLARGHGATGARRLAFVAAPAMWHPLPPGAAATAAVAAAAARRLTAVCRRRTSLAATEAPAPPPRRRRRQRGGGGNAAAAGPATVAAPAAAGRQSQADGPPPPQPSMAAAAAPSMRGARRHQPKMGDCGVAANQLSPPPSRAPPRGGLRAICRHARLRAARAPTHHRRGATKSTWPARAAPARLRLPPLSRRGGA